VAVKVEILEVNAGTVSPSQGLAGSWIYAWVTRPEGQVIYVGSTSMSPWERAHLHLHHADPEVARVAMLRPSAMCEQFLVVAVTVDDGANRTAAKFRAISLLRECDLLGPDYVGPAPVATTSSGQHIGAASDLLRAIREVVSGL